MKVVVHKFGGTSVGDADRILAARDLVVASASSSRPVVVLSAMAGVTNDLIAAIELAADGSIQSAEDALKKIALRHREAATQLEVSCTVIDSLFGRIGDLVRATAVVGAVSPRARDWIQCVGEKLAVRIFAELLGRAGVPAVALDADTFLETDDQFGSANPLYGLYEAGVRSAIGAVVEVGAVPVVTGFCGRAPDGSTSTLGRGGSDYSATLFAAALEADSVVIWTDVSGVYTADPRLVDGARVVPHLHYREAGELAYFGAKVLHPRTLKPVAGPGIPVWIRNSFEPSAVGTRIDRHSIRGSHPVKAISAIGRHALLSLEGTGMAGVPGVAARLFAALATDGISVTAISQSSAESSICVAIPETDAVRAELAVRRAFRLDLAHGDVEDVRLVPQVGLVAAVGLGMAHVPGIAARATSALAGAGINVMAIAQGASELNLTIAIREPSLPTALAALHAEFGLHQIDTGDAEAAAFDLIILGWGNIARALADLVMQRNDEIARRVGVRGRVVAICDRSGFLLRPTGIPRADLAAAADAKANGSPVASLEGAEAGDLDALIERACGYRLVRPVLIDLTDVGGNETQFIKGLTAGWDVVTANKKPLAGSADEFRRLYRHAESVGRVIRAEGTVGAGLPVVDTLDMLLVTGDALVRADGCLSGTLAFVLSQLEDGVPFSDAVREAHARGYTEPDPYADLSGADVARKSIIISRIAGFDIAPEAVSVEGLVPPEFAGLPLETFFEHIEALNETVGARVRRARESGAVLRYLGRVHADRIEVGLSEVPLESALGRLTGTDNMIVFHSERYADTPLVVQGPGAGIDVTAMGVLGDIVRTVAQRLR